MVRQQALEIGNVLRQVLDVLIGERARNALHVAAIVGARVRLEIAELLLDVCVLLSREAGHFVLAHEAAAMAHRA